MLFLYGRPIRRQILCQIGNGVPCDLHGSRGPRGAGGKLGIDPGGVVHEIGIKPSGLDLLIGQIPGQLVDDCPHHLQVPQFLSPH